MHRGHDHDHTAVPPHGRNERAAQWQTPHLPDGAGDAPEIPASEKDIDLVERAFCEGFAGASDPTSFLRLAGVPFEREGADGRRLVLLRVEHQRATDIGAISPQLGGEGFRYDPLPQALASRRERLSFIYTDGAETVPLSFAEATAGRRAG